MTQSKLQANDEGAIFTMRGSIVWESQIMRGYLLNEEESIMGEYIFNDGSIMGGLFSMSVG